MCSEKFAILHKLNGTKYSRMDQVKFVKDSVLKNRPYPFKFFKSCLPQFYLAHSWILCSKCSNRSEIKNNDTDKTNKMDWQEKDLA